MKRDLHIDWNHSLSIQKQCELLDISRSTAYYRPRPESELNLMLMFLMDRHYLDHPELGVPGMYAWLRYTKGQLINYKRVERLYSQMGLQSIAPGPNTSKKTTGVYVYPYLLSTIEVTTPNQVWAADITYIPMPVGFMYKFAIIDLFSRYLVGWDISSTMEASWCCQVYKDCLKRHGSPGIINTDQGSQFTSNEWVDSVRDSGAKISMDGKNRAIDNVFIERYWRSLKYEWVYPHPASTGQELYGGIKTYVRYYNEERLHSSLQHQTPFAVYRPKK